MKPTIIVNNEKIFYLEQMITMLNCILIGGASVMFYYEFNLFWAFLGFSIMLVWWLFVEFYYIKYVRGE